MMEHEGVVGNGQVEATGGEKDPRPGPALDASGVQGTALSERALTLPSGASRLCLKIEAPRDTRLEVDVEAHTADGRLLGRQKLVFGSRLPGGVSRSLPAAGGWERVWSGLAARGRTAAASLPVWLTWLALGLYAFIYLFALPSFPIYFFTDEAAQTVKAADLLRDHFISPSGEFLPTYFENGSQYNLSASVYLQVLPYILFGKSIWVTRGAAALMTLIAALSVGRIASRVFHLPYPWLAVMLLAITPAWFLHARTAFETALAASFYASFLYCYLMYRLQDPRYLFAAVAMAALVFYSYSAMRPVMGVTALLLLCSDARYHWQQRRVVLGGLGLALLLGLPFLRFLLVHPEASGWQMRLLGSYWVLDFPLTQKLASFAAEYLRGLDPLYWYLPHSIDLPRHTMPGYGHLLRETLPFGLLGVVLALRQFRSPQHRALLLAVLAAPSGAALVRLGITRVLVMVIPMAILTALGVCAVMEWLRRKWNIPRAALSLAVFAVLAVGSLSMLRDALVNGPLWYHDYGLTGMQYGAREVFAAIDGYQKEHPDTHIILSPSWSNGTDVVARFFFPDPLPFELGSITGYFQAAQPIPENTLFIMIPEEFAAIPRTRFTDIRVEKVLPYPDGRPGFYFVRMKYVDGIQHVIAEEEAARRKPIIQELSLSTVGELKATCTSLDIGSLPDLFDGNPATLVRTAAINPLELGLDFPAPRKLEGLTLRIGGAATSIHLRLGLAGSQQPVEMEKMIPEFPSPRDIHFTFSDVVEVEQVWMEIKNTNDPPEGHVHLWEVTLH